MGDIEGRALMNETGDLKKSASLTLSLSEETEKVLPMRRGPRQDMRSTGAVFLDFLPPEL